MKPLHGSVQALLAGLASLFMAAGLVTAAGECPTRLAQYVPREFGETSCTVEDSPMFVANKLSARRPNELDAGYVGLEESMLKIVLYEFKQDYFKQFDDSMRPTLMQNAADGLLRTVNTKGEKEVRGADTIYWRKRTWTNQALVTRDRDLQATVYDATLVRKTPASILTVEITSFSGKEETIQGWMALIGAGKATGAAPSPRTRPTTAPSW